MWAARDAPWHIGYPPGRMFRLPWFAALLSLCSCIRDNPAFDLLETSAGLTLGTTVATSETTTSDPTTGPADPTTTASEPSTGPDVCGDDDECSDGLFCNGLELCVPGTSEADLAGCAPGTPPCGLDQTCQEVGAVCLGACEVDADLDNDGVDGLACGGTDCDDTNPEIGPDKAEVCDALGIDEDCNPATLGPDADADGVPFYQCCNAGVCGQDCDDALPGVSGPGDWAHCAACGQSCGALEGCIAGACVGARRVFATSKTYTGKLDGLLGADGQCQKRADTAGLGGTFKAYLTDKNTGLDRLEHPNVSFVRLDGVVIANDWNDLTDGSLDAPLERDEFRQLAGFNAWAGVKEVNGPGIVTCENWTFEGGGCLENQKCGGGGVVANTDNLWDGFYIYDCDELFRLYCIEQG